jgi:hypothetical protein
MGAQSLAAYVRLKSHTIDICLRINPDITCTLVLTGCGFSLTLPAGKQSETAMSLVTPVPFRTLAAANGEKETRHALSLQIQDGNGTNSFLPIYHREDCQKKPTHEPKKVTHLFFFCHI